MLLHSDCDCTFTHPGLVFRFLCSPQEPGCSSNGRYLSSDFPGHLRSTLQEAYGEDHTVLYMNGAIGEEDSPLLCCSNSPHPTELSSRRLLCPFRFPFTNPTVVLYIDAWHVCSSVRMVSCCFFSFSRRADRSSRPCLGSEFGIPRHRRRIQSACWSTDDRKEFPSDLHDWVATRQGRVGCAREPQPGNQVASFMHRSCPVPHPILHSPTQQTMDGNTQHLRSFPESQNYQFRYSQREFLFRGTNLKFRMAMSPASAIGGDPNLPAIMGHRLRRGYICEPLSLEEKAEVLQMGTQHPSIVSSPLISSSVGVNHIFWMLCSF